MRNRGVLISSALVLLAVQACNTATLPSAQQSGRLNVYLTDAPLDDVASATVTISKVYLIGGSDESGSRFTVTDTPQDYDLLTLQDGVTALLGSASIPAGDYTQLRLVVDQATITLAAGVTFSDGSSSKTLKVPSGGQSGIKIQLAGPLHIEPGETNLIVDFDVSQNFVFTGEPSHPNGVLFKPVLHASLEDAAAP